MGRLSSLDAAPDLLLNKRFTKNATNFQMHETRTQISLPEPTSMGLRKLLQALGVLSYARRIAKAWGRGHVSSAELWKRYNLNQIQRYEALLNRRQLSLKDFSSILDFGCGPGRHTRYLASIIPETNFFGCDIDSLAVEEAQRGCPQARFSTNQVFPPLDYEDEQFDLILSFGVFTELSQRAHESWLKELGKKLKPGGVFLHTIHSYEYLKRVALFSPYSLAKYQLPQAVDAFIESDPGYYFVPYRLSNPDYGLAIISKEYVVAKWPQLSGLSLVDYAEGDVEGYPEGCHDLVMLAKN